MGWGESEYTVVGDNNKILTVSYGTFSCTLEGFDDPFSMMKAIAEYFRDLTAGDRFFGAEPPQPDTDALHKIAKQTANTSVDVEVSDNAMILRNANGDGGYETVGKPAAIGAVAAALTSGVAGATTATPLTTLAPTPPSNFGTGDSVAEKLQRIRAAVSRDVAEPEDVAAFFSEDQHADEVSDNSQADDVANTAATYDDTVETDQTISDTDVDTVETSVADTVADAASTDMVEDDNADAHDESAAADDGTPETAIDEDDSITQADAAEADETEAETSKDTSSDEALSDDVAAAETADEVEATSDDEADADAQDAKLDADSSEADRAETVAEPDVDADAPDADADTNEAEADIAAADIAETDVDADIADVVEADGAAKPRRRIMVQKISRADVEAAQPGGSANDTQPEADAAELSPEAEAELMRELQSVEADMDTSGAASLPSDLAAEAMTPVETPSAEAEALTGAAPKRAVITSKLRPGETEEQRQARLERRALMVEDEDAALNRLMDATSSRLSDDDEGAVRRASIAHLKAAVAATKADDSIAQAAAVEEERELDQYRSDLAKVVRPSKSKPAVKEGDAARSRPLMLVSEQRIEEPADDTPAVAARDLRSRPITAGNLALQEQVEEELKPVADAQAEDFEGFAARFGALELPDLLEAAAAHFTYVEGTPSFTRPMLMRKISSASSAQNISREAGLRSFGALLREGKLIKGDDGKFVISGNTRFAP